MNRPFHLIVNEMPNRTVSSWGRASAFGHSGALLKFAHCAPHAPCESQSHFVFGELSTKICRTTADRDALKRLQLRTSDSKNSAVIAAIKVSNRPLRTASEKVHKTHLPRRKRSYVAEVNRAARIQNIIGIVHCAGQTVARYEIPARLRFQLSVNDPLYRRTRATTSSAIQHTTLLHRLIEPRNLPSAAGKKARLGATGSHENNPTKALS